MEVTSAVIRPARPPANAGFVFSNRNIRLTGRPQDASTTFAFAPQPGFVFSNHTFRAIDGLTMRQIMRPLRLWVRFVFVE
jgi:hypothetical protein